MRPRLMLHAAASLTLSACALAACAADETDSTVPTVSVAGAGGQSAGASGAGAAGVSGKSGGAGAAGVSGAGAGAAGASGAGAAGASGKSGGAGAGAAGASGQSGAAGAAGAGGKSSGGGAAGAGGKSSAAGAAGAASGSGGAAGQGTQDPCAGRQNGAWCGQSIGGESDHLYDCQGDKTASNIACAHGCSPQPPGVADVCKPGPSTYSLPFACGVSRPCTQGNNGSTSHSGKEAYAWDFAMSSGSDVVAARGGTVSHADFPSAPGSACYDGGGSSCANLANRVIVDHGDGTSAAYYHLSQLSVSKGKPVKAGELLGKSGNSGWSTGPHLHFMVMQTCGSWYCQSVSISFGDVGVPAAGKSYTSGNCP